jgi:Glutathione S-transferase, C-terminal domain
MTLSTETPVQFKYLNFLPYGARGGVTRFFLLSQGIQFEEELIKPGDDWAAEKKRLIETGENPSGSAPILYSGKGGKGHPQHIAVSRYLARVHKLTSGDDYKDYVQDLVADEYQGFRDQWVQVTFMGNDDDKAEYKKGDLIKHLTKFDALYNTFKTEDVYLSVSAKTGEPLWGDAAVFGLLRDHILTGYITNDDLKEYSNLTALYESYGSIPAVKEWMAKVEA